MLRLSLTSVRDCSMAICSSAAARLASVAATASRTLSTSAFTFLRSCRVALQEERRGGRGMVVPLVHAGASPASSGWEAGHSHGQATATAMAQQARAACLIFCSKLVAYCCAARSSCRRCCACSCLQPSGVAGRGNELGVFGRVHNRDSPPARLLLLLLDVVLAGALRFERSRS